jgi:ComF family protein
MQRVLALVYPDQCVLCENRVAERGGLCSGCWSKTPFLTCLVCHTCGASLPGADADVVFCDDCLAMPRPWEAGRAALSYRDAGRRVVLALKHADRLDIVPACASWMVRAGKPVLDPDTLLLPVPIHWTRLLTRRYNQAAELCRGVSSLTGLTALPDGLRRTRRTPKQDGMTVDERFANMLDAIRVDPKAEREIAGRRICLIDDVMTSGATLTSATEALHDAGAAQVCTLVLARVEKAP